MYKLDDDYDERIIRDLVPEEFDEIVMQDTEYTWIVEFYSDRCTAVYFFYYFSSLFHITLVKKYFFFLNNIIYFFFFLTFIEISHYFCSTTCFSFLFLRLFFASFLSLSSGPFCKSLAPEMKKASKMTEEVIPGKTRFGAVNSRVYEDMAERFGITGWPWVTSFHLGEKVEDMAGLGGAQSVVNWAQKMVEKTNPKGGVSRLSDE